MTVVSEIEEKIAATQAEIEAVLSRLNEMGDLEKALGTASGRIGDAATSVAEVSNAITSATGELMGATTALREVAQAVHEAEPAQVIEMLQRVLKRLEAMPSDLAKQTTESIEEWSQKMDQLRTQTLTAVSDLDKLLTTVSNDQKAVSSRTTADVGKLRTTVNMVVMVAGLTLAAQAYLIFMLWR